MRQKTPSHVNFPAYLLNFPFTLDNKVVNNAIMEEFKDAVIDYDRAYKQWMELYWHITKDSLVYILPSKGNFQDQVYVANLACYLPDSDKVLLSNYTSEPRIGEEKIGLDFFQMMGYDVLMSPTKFEGEADLKYIRDNLYIGGYGIRSQQETHRWLEEQTGANVVSIEMNDPKLYHFDCVVLPLTKESALVAVDGVSKADLKKIEQVVDVVPLPKEWIYEGLTNSLVHNGKVFYAPSHDECANPFDKLMERYGFQATYVDLEEYEKSGAGLSCMVFHFNYRGL